MLTTKGDRCSDAVNREMLRELSAGQAELAALLEEKAVAAELAALLEEGTAAAQRKLDAGNRALILTAYNNLARRRFAIRGTIRGAIGAEIKAHRNGAVVTSEIFNGVEKFSTWRYFDAEYPYEPGYVIGRKRFKHRGLRCILNDESAADLRMMYPTWQPGDTMEVRAIRITRFSSTGASAFCNVTEWGEIRTRVRDSKEQHAQI